MKKICCFMLSLLPICLFASQANTFVVTPKSNTITVNITGNATTGYSWFLQSYDSKLLKPISYRYIPVVSRKRIGAPGTFQFVFKALPAAFVVPQATKIQFVYARPWMHAGGSVETVVVRTSQ